MAEALGQKTSDQEARQTVEGIFRSLTEEQRLDLVFGLLKQCATLAADYARVKTEVETLRASLRDALQTASDGKLKDEKIASLEKELERYKKESEAWMATLQDADKSITEEIDGLKKKIEALTAANALLESINQALQKELKELKDNLEGLDGIFADPKFLEEVNKWAETAENMPELQKLLDEMTVERDKLLERIKALEAGTPAPKVKSGRRRMIKPAIALLGLTCTASAVPAGNAIMNETSLARYCASDTVRGTFYEMNHLPFAPKDDTTRVITGLFHRQATADGGTNSIATILLTPPSDSRIAILPRQCGFRIGELPRVLATHQTGRDSPFFIRIAEGSDHRWLHFEPSVKPKKLKWHGETKYVGTTVPKGERIVLAVDGKKIITEMILTDSPSLSVNVGFMFAADWFSSRLTDRLGLSQTEITSEKAFDASDRVTATGEEWVESRSQ